jgi:hypothetical protein
MTTELPTNKAGALTGRNAAAAVVADEGSAGREPREQLRG